MQVEESTLPGLGRRVAFRELKSGRSITVVLLENGTKELYIDADGIEPVVLHLEAEEGRLIGQALVSEYLPKTFIDYVSRSFQGGVSMDQYSIASGSPIAGSTILETDLRASSGASIIALIKDGKSWYNPPPTARIEPGDVVVLVGDEEQLHRARAIILGHGAGPKDPSA